MSFPAARFVPLGLSVIAGCVLPLAFPPFNWAWVYWLIWPLVIHLLDTAPKDRRVRHGAWIGYGFGIGQFAVGLSWIGNAFQVNPAVFGWLEPIALIAIALGFAIFPALSCAVAMVFWQKHPSRLAVLALAWIAAEWLRGHILTGFPWNLVGLAFVATDRSLQIDALIGPYGLSILAVLIGSAPILLFDRPLPWRSFLALASLLPIVMVYGAWRLSRPEPPSPGIQLRIVQPDMPEPAHHDLAFVRTEFQRLVEMTKEPGAFDLALWPEASVFAVLDQQKEALDAIAQAIGPDRLVLTGTFRVAPEGQFYNSIDVVNGSGTVIASYDKAHLVPFGEYLPLRQAFGALGLHGLAENMPGGMAEGPGIQTISLDHLPPFSPLVCYEILFSGEVIAPKAPRARWIANVTNDDWFGQSIGPHQHFAQARLRAVEEGVPVARAANSGISALVDAKGRVKSQLDLGTKGILDAELPAALDPPLDSRGPIWLVLALLCALWPALVQMKRRF